MRKFKGIELPVNSVIVIALAIFVLLMLAAFFGKSGGEMDRTQLQSAFNQACYQLSSANNCDTEKAKTMMSGYISSGKALSFVDVCRSYLNDMTADAAKCVKNCPQCNTQYVSSGSACPEGVAEGADCGSPYGTLICKTGICCAELDTSDGKRCTSGTTTGGGTLSNGAFCPATATGYDRTSCSSGCSTCHVTDATNKKCGC
jgi:hypothetical protein